MTFRRFVVSLVFTLFAAAAAVAQESETPRFEVGGHFSSITVAEPESFPLPGQARTVRRTEAGFGGRFTYNFTDSVAAEAEVNFFPHDAVSFNDYTDGRATQALFGVKAGRRFGKYGLFGKARPGFVRFGRAFNGTRAETAIGGGTFFAPQRTGRTGFALDVGGAIEMYPSRRIMTRFDIGDTIVRFADLTYQFTSPPPAGPPPPRSTFTVTLPAVTTHNFQFTAGVGFRF